MRIIKGLDSFTDGHKEPKVISALINKMCYWAIDYYPKNGQNNVPLKIDKNKIIVHPKGMTGYALAYFDLFEQLSKHKVEANDIEKKISSILYHDIKPGDEKKWYDKRDYYLSKKQRENHKIGYITMDPIDMYLFSNDKEDYHIVQKAFYRQQNDDGFRPFENVIMTSLVTSKEDYIDDEKKAIIDNLILGIKAAIKFIKEDPVTASEILMQYKDEHFYAKEAGWTSEYMRKFFEEVLVADKIYNEDLKLYKCSIANSKKIWEKSLSEELKKRLTTIENYFEFDCPCSLTLIEQAKQSIQNKYNRFRQYERNVKDNELARVPPLFQSIRDWLFPIGLGFTILSVIYFILQHLIKDVELLKMLSSSAMYISALCFFLGLLYDIFAIVVDYHSIKPFRSFLSSFFFITSLWVLTGKLSQLTESHYLGHEIFSPSVVAIVLELVKYNKRAKPNLGRIVENAKLMWKIRCVYNRWKSEWEPSWLPQSKSITI
jgi:hypothetical protein